MRIPIILLCCLCIAACATRSPAGGPPIYGDLEDRMQSPNSAEEAPQGDREEDWPAGRFGLNWEGLKIAGMIVAIFGLMSIVQHNSSASIGSSSGGGGSPLPRCDFVLNPSPGFNCL